jgi:hypothetical protein
MAAIALSNSLSLGENGYPPTLPESGLSNKTQAENKFIVLKDQTIYAPHVKSRAPIHQGELRLVIGGSSKVYVENKAIARKGDALADGDIINEGASKVFAE